ncbi:MAG: DNA-methyltransferase [Candidatus Heimdallarchaeaceae archaeon]
MKALYRTRFGTQYVGDSSCIENTRLFNKLEGKCNLIFTSPPFPLNKKKAYGNLKGEKYLEWLEGYGKLFKKLLAPDGSLVIELGNAWIKGSPTMSLFPLQSLIKLKEAGEFHLCQEFIWYNTTRLPSPAQWVNIERIRVKDSFTRLWWLSSTPRPKADNRNVLVEYSDAMKKLLERQSYNSGVRPSEHNIGETSFLKNNNGAISPNVLTIANTSSSDPYLEFCKKNKIKYHPARMPYQLAEFFIKFLTDPKDIVVDPFSGSNVTGYVAEILGRKWRSIEKEPIYAYSSKSRFEKSWFVRKKDQKWIEEHHESKNI